MSRVNHKCAANAGTISASESKVMILYSMKDIEKGEEICTSYIYMDDKRFAKDPIPTDGTRLYLKNTYGIICPPDCIYRDKEMQMIAKEHTQLFDNMNEWSPTHLVNPNLLMMPTIKRLVEICETVPILEGNIVDILLNAYCAARHATGETVLGTVQSFGSEEVSSGIREE
ncbi:uncharacterized protein LOC118433873 [Folsomia candida]|nr:uncharacterized protein LOC118433873 [Folsomia candida]